MEKKLNMRLDDAIHLNGLEPKKALKKMIGRIGETSFWPDVRYTTTDSQLYKFINGETTESEALSYPDGLAKPLNRKNNKQTIKLGLKHFKAVQPSHGFKIDPRLWGLRPDVMLNCKIPFGYVENDQTILFVPHYRKGPNWGLTTSGLYLQASVISQVFAQDEDFKGAIVETVDMCVPPKQTERYCVVKRYQPEELLSGLNLIEQFANLIDTWDVLRAQEEEQTATKPKFFD